MGAAIKSMVIVVVSLWCGTLFFVGFVFAPYIFGRAARGDANVPHTGVAADLVGPLLYGADVAGLVVVWPLLVGLVYLRCRRQTPLGGRFYLCEIALLIASVCLAVNYWGLTPRVQAVKQSLAERYGTFHLADKTDALYDSFSALHHTATALYMIVFVCSLTCLICLTHFKPLDREAPT